MFGAFFATGSYFTGTYVIYEGVTTNNMQTITKEWKDIINKLQNINNKLENTNNKLQNVNQGLQKIINSAKE